MIRRDKDNYYLDIADTVRSRSTCLRRNYVAIIVKHDQIISTGYVGSPRGRKNCSDLGYCMREKLHIPRGERYEMCRSVHAEQNAIIHASRNDMLGATLFLVGRECGNGNLIQNATPCALCKKFILNAGISRVVIRVTDDTYTDIDVANWIADDDSLNGTFGY